LRGLSPQTAYLQGINRIQEIYSGSEYACEINHFSRVLDGKIGELALEDLHSSGYVIHSLEASLWCLLNSSSYPETVLAAVNLGGDTDTTGAITGGLAGIYYGFDHIPPDWIQQIARKQDVIDLATRLSLAIADSIKEE
jgi:ADP-ribosylglycohydrolase